MRKSFKPIARIIASLTAASLYFALPFTVFAADAPLRLADRELGVKIQEVDYLKVDGTTFKGTIYQPEGTGPFPALLDVHGGAWIAPIRRDANAIMDKALAAKGVVVFAIDFRHDPLHHYPDSVADVNFAIRWLRANASKYNASPNSVGAMGTSSGGHLVLLNALRPTFPRYASLPLADITPDQAEPDYAILAYPISDPSARKEYVVQVGNPGPAKATDTFFANALNLAEGNPQLILERHERVRLPNLLLIQGSADSSGLVADKNVSPEIQQRFAGSYRAAGGDIQLELLPGAAHGFVGDPGPNFERALGLITSFINGQLTKPRT